MVIIKYSLAMNMFLNDDIFHLKFFHCIQTDLMNSEQRFLLQGKTSI